MVGRWGRVASSWRSRSRSRWRWPQFDEDGDAVGDVCDRCPPIADPGQADAVFGVGQVGLRVQQATVRFAYAAIIRLD